MNDLRNVYLDHAATTPVDTRVVEAMTPYLTEVFGNANSLYGIGRDAFRALEDARARVAGLIGAKEPREVIFTSGGTESDNTAILGIPRAIAPDGGHVVVSAFEHHAVLEPAHLLEKSGYEVTYLKPREDGLVHPEDVAAALRPDTVLVSVMHGNNEIGTIQPIRAIADVVHERGALMHTDAAQTLGKIPFDVVELGVDAASFSGHKLYAPKGVGVLYVRRGVRFKPLIIGGGQEFRMRSGTQNVAGAQAFARALEIMVEEQDSEFARLSGLRDRLEGGVMERLENTEVSAKSDSRLPNIAHMIIKGVEGEAMLLQLDAKGISISTGSACSSGSLEPSHVLLSIGCPAELAHGSIRASMGRSTTVDDIDYFLEVFPPIVERLRAMSPVYEKMFGSSAD